MNYEGMSQLAVMYAGKPFVVLAFPCNQFDKQEPKSNADIEAFVRCVVFLWWCGLDKHKHHKTPQARILQPTAVCWLTPPLCS